MSDVILIKLIEPQGAAFVKGFAGNLAELALCRKQPNNSHSKRLVVEAFEQGYSRRLGACLPARCHTLANKRGWLPLAAQRQPAAHSGDGVLHTQAEWNWRKRARGSAVRACPAGRALWFTEMSVCYANRVYTGHLVNKRVI